MGRSHLLPTWVEVVLASTKTLFLDQLAAHIQQPGVQKTFEITRMLADSDLLKRNYKQQLKIGGGEEMNDKQLFVEVFHFADWKKNRSFGFRGRRQWPAWLAERGRILLAV